jgi:hypothetical protein
VYEPVSGLACRSRQARPDARVALLIFPRREVSSAAATVRADPRPCALSLSAGPGRCRRSATPALSELDETIAGSAEAMAEGR